MDAHNHGSARHNQPNDRSVVEVDGITSDHQSSKIAVESSPRVGDNVDLAGASISRTSLEQASAYITPQPARQADQTETWKSADLTVAGHGFAAVAGMCLSAPFFPAFMAPGVSQVAAFISAGAALYVCSGKRSSMVAAVYGGFVGASAIIHYLANQGSWLSNLSWFNAACAVAAGAVVVAELGEKREQVTKSA